ncbi:hypothetical protein GWI33_018664 [Rhynchophorus ferrugineus]|uniref:Uncharacterized protein n=1 Tax=Rhynchophorus ferrugineus TaxID=354439 RepID=A0A834HVY2_RHYFE|nr:hypothetical protein GWI33_018664 [Rhynchophorus ferrugineus]
MRRNGIGFEAALHGAKLRSCCSLNSSRIPGISKPRSQRGAVHIFRDRATDNSAPTTPAGPPVPEYKILRHNSIRPVLVCALSRNYLSLGCVFHIGTPVLRDLNWRILTTFNSG